MALILAWERSRDKHLRIHLWSRRLSIHLEVMPTLFAAPIANRGAADGVCSAAAAPTMG
ncbi:hypothetical protein GCM10010532_104250 [Dactylosporangium siamense]|uniref:Uncharacterized protein n=1 Tax=Dactylosporangium siamense TaxID=685454 RepID=A0A919PWR6_9ACTN|nr:hypothetical protein Dsi01nite_095950 [Dactylosporangium siamense]